MTDKPASEPPVDASVLHLVSPLPLEECCRRLQAAMDSPWVLFGSRPVIGSIAKGRLQASKRIQGRNSFQTRLTAELTAEGDRTLIRCQFGMHPFVRAFMALWLGGAVVTGLGWAGVSLVTLLTTSSDAHAGTWFGLLAPIGPLMFGWGLLWLGRYMARSERDVLTAFVRDTLNTHQS